MATTKLSDIPYEERTDLQKITSQWNKVGGILERQKEWSAAIVRATISSEIAANFVVRRRTEQIGMFPDGFVDGLLRWANGIDGKFRYLLIPLAPNDEERGRLRALYAVAQDLNKRRNEILHSGDFSDEEEARILVGEARRIVEGLVLPFDPHFRLPPKAVAFLESANPQ